MKHPGLRQAAVQRTTCEAKQVLTGLSEVLEVKCTDNDASSQGLVLAAEIASCQPYRAHLC